MEDDITTPTELALFEGGPVSGFEVLRRTRPGMGGEQILARFPNGFGVSIVRGFGTYGSDAGLWELAVTQYVGAGWEDFELSYDTPVTDDVLGYLSEPEAVEVARRVAALSSDGAS